MGKTHSPSPISPGRARRRKIETRVETQLDQKAEPKNSQEVLGVASNPRKEDQPISQGQPKNQGQPMNRAPSVDLDQPADQDQPMPDYKDGEWDEVDLELDQKYAQAFDARIRRIGWAKGKREEEYYRTEYRFDHRTLFHKRNYRTPMNSTVSRGPNSMWDTNLWLRDRRSEKQIVELKKGDSKNSRLRRIVKRNQQAASESNVFLQMRHAELEGDWKGVKILGKGGQGIVGLWEYVWPEGHPWGKRVVVKMTLNDPFNHERDMMLLLGNDNPLVNHVTKLLSPINTQQRNADREIDKMILEFCEGGDLNNLILDQKKKGYNFSEHTLWFFFECFVKGLNVIDHGDESPTRKPDSRSPICHFDLKPLNILIGTKDDGEHKHQPILKIADYGLAEVIDPVNYTEVSRGRGTPGYLLPEQFSRRWAYDDAATAGHVNVWGTHSNIWGIGLIMYMLATLSGPPRPKGFRCALIGNRFTYGYKLNSRNISNTLKRLIWRCLCDKPKERPSLAYLDREIKSSMEVIRKKLTNYPLGIEPAEPQDPNKVVGKEKQKAKVPSEGPNPLNVKLGQRGGKEKEKTEQEEEKKARDLGQGPGWEQQAKGHIDAPILIRGGTAVLRMMVVTFCVVPKHLPRTQQAPIWFTASIDATVKQLKAALREEAGLALANGEQFIYSRVAPTEKPGGPQDVLLSNEQGMLTSGYGVGEGTRLELWTSQEDHDANEPQEADFDVV